MSRRPAALLALLSLLPHAPALAQEPEIPVLAGSNTLSSTGAASIDVTLPEGASFVMRTDAPRAPGWADITTTGSFAALAIVSKAETVNGGTARVNAVELQLVAPDACSGDPSPAAPPLCVSPYRHTVFQSPTPPTLDQGNWLYPYAGGEYTLYLLTDPGATVTATFELRGLQGTRTLEARGPAEAEFDRVRDAGPLAASINGAHSRVMSGNGFVTLGFYHVAAGAPDQPGLFNYAECLTKGTPGPLSPNECIPLILTGQELTVGEQPILVKPTTGAFHGGAWTLENSGLLTLQSPTIGPGLWTNTYRVQRGGPGAAAGAWALWLELD